MRNNEIVLYGIGGLGADHRVFNFLTLNCRLVSIKWIEHNEEESLSAYALRLASQIDEKERFGLLGVSFGGLVAIELNKIVNPIFTILISSASKSTDLPRIKSLVKKVNILPLLPNSFLKPPFFIMKYLFGAGNSKLLKEIINDTDPEFLRWAIGEIINWNYTDDTNNLHLIHGSKDRLIPIKNKSSLVIDNGAHFMIVDNASQISKIVNTISSQY